VFLPPMIIVAEKLRKAQGVFLFAIAMLVVAETGLAFSTSYLATFAMLVLFFGAFNFLEAMLPANVTRIAPADMKGTAMGLFSSAQFFGAFCGGLVGGVLLATGDYATTFAWLAGILGLWFLLALTMKAPAYLKSRIVSLKALEQTEIDKFVDRAMAIAGVKEVSVYEADRVAYLKVEKSFDEAGLQALVTRH
jgi:MFS family permease